MMLTELLVPEFTPPPAETVGPDGNLSEASASVATFNPDALMLNRSF